MWSITFPHNKRRLNNETFVPGDFKGPVSSAGVRREIARVAQSARGCSGRPSVPVPAPRPRCSLPIPLFPGSRNGHASLSREEVTPHRESRSPSPSPVPVTVPSNAIPAPRRARTSAPLPGASTKARFSSSEGSTTRLHEPPFFGRAHEQRRCRFPGREREEGRKKKTGSCRVQARRGRTCLNMSAQERRETPTAWLTGTGQRAPPSAQMPHAALLWIIYPGTLGTPHNADHLRGHCPGSSSGTF
ncbi:hypothetical protein SKAU_G00125970 [Synaphobranchus kaupii]|uniref:Uncharacterized protein n=1 Tax=Synaphobranchus kaupii TaxID=118154 RepID=A0A9Q1FQ09_SYNKA|nr:hypothetical protein SKAU_G00125970 [Synaphobranchus kaupii]